MPRHLEEGHIEVNFNLIHMTCTPKKNRATTSFFPPNFQYNEISGWSKLSASLDFIIKREKYLI